MLRIDPSSATPPFEQLRSQVVEQIAAGELAPGTRLPSVRRLAGDLGLAPNTVARTYRELEAAGYVHTAGRNGTVVATPAAASTQTDQQAQQLADQYVTGMRGLGLRPDDMQAYLQRALGAVRSA